eukprot:365889-Chlamydomonas_euryale.AAC.16
MAGGGAEGWKLLSSQRGHAPTSHFPGHMPSTYAFAPLSRLQVNASAAFPRVAAGLLDDRSGDARAQRRGRQAAAFQGLAEERKCGRCRPHGSAAMSQHAPLTWHMQPSDIVQRPSLATSI